MGQLEINGKGAAMKKKTRGSVRNSARLDAFASKGGEGEADWIKCNGSTMRAVVARITALGGAVTFGLSRDLGAHSLTLMLDGSRQTLWFNGGDDLTTKLEEVKVTLDSMD